MSISRQFSQNLLSIYNQTYNLSQILAFTYLSGIYPTASTGTRSTQYLAEEGDKEDVELPLFELKTIIQATDNFSRDNKLGEGGFGPVYQVNITCFLLLLVDHCYLHGKLLTDSFKIQKN